MLDKLRAMAIFASVVQNGSFSRSAEELGITTSAVSQQIRSLETDLGVVLLNRSTRKISLTEPGEVFFERCQNMVKEASIGRAMVEGLRDDMSGTVRLATSPVLALKLIMPCLKIWLSNTPDLSFNLLSDFMHIDLIDRQIDLAVRCSEKQTEAHFDHDELGTIPMMLWGSPEYLKKFGGVLTSKTLDQANLITVDDAKDSYLSRIEAGNKKLRCSSNLATNSPDTAKDLAVNGLGIVKLPLCDVLDEIESGDLVCAAPEIRMSDLCLFIVTLKQSQQPVKIAKAAELIKNYYQNEFFPQMERVKDMLISSNRMYG